MKKPLLLALLLASVFALGSLGSAGAAKPKKPKITKIHHVGSFYDMPGSQVSFTLVKKGGKLIKATNVQVSGFSVWCAGNGQVTPATYATTFPSMRVGKALGLTGFAVEDIPLTEFEWGYKRFAAFLTHKGRKAHGDARIRWEQGGITCGGVPSEWSSQAV